jgi:hypothetical protein
VALVRGRLAAIWCAFAAACAVTPALGDDFGTLFHTPKERADLDRLRRGEPVGPTGQPQETYRRADPVVTGYVKRSDGKSTVFIDEHPYPMHGKNLQEKLDPRMVQRYFEPPPPPPRVEQKPKAADNKALGTAPSRSNVE